ncbi:YdbH domain-containing protein [Sphingomonas rubra]|uniref:YdbH domain-containing protein n=1 Tax=Sphingomonas rubra TaxID=634430 RepID=UPI001FDF99EB|nr:YdbH domain-containing protein [Sphingomonas rubra]
MDDNSDLPPRRRPRRRRRIAALLAVVIVAALIVLWSQRRTIAGRFVDRELATRGVPARYAIADLGLGRQRLTDVVIGDPAHPDLVADWIETRVGYGLGGPRLEGVAAGRVRLRGRLVDGRVSLGAIDRLLPPPSGAPLTLPKLDVDVEDARLRLDTAYGIVGVRLAGRGRLDDGFSGQLAIAADRLERDGCAATGVRAAWRVRTTGVDRRDGQGLRLDGPLLAERLRCAGVSIADWRSDLHGRVALGAPRRSAIEARIATGPVAHARGSAAAVAGTLAYDGRGAERGGRVDLTARAVRAAGARAGSARLMGDLAIRRDGVIGYHGRIALAEADLSALVPSLGGRAPGTPVAPLLDRVGEALHAAARRGQAEATVHAEIGDAVALSVESARWQAASGAVATLAPQDDDGAAMRWRSGAGVVADARLALAGGDLPSARITVSRPAAGRAWRGTATIAPYSVGTARLATTPVAFALTDRGALRLSTQATVSGPLGDGRVEALVLPIDLRRDVGGELVLNPGCAPVGWRALAVGPLALDAGQLRLCPTGPALVSVRDGRVDGGARTPGARLRGRLGGSPLLLDLGAADIGLGSRSFTVADVTALIGSPERRSRLSIAMLTGSLAGGPAGTFVGGGGQIGAVPLVLSAAQGRWAFANGALTLDGSMAVADAAASPRFKPMVVRDVDLRLAGGRITANGTLIEPVTDTRVATVRLDHLLGAGTGSADLSIPSLVFKQGFQPDLLTPLTFGVVADVRGTVTGAARIDWGPKGVRSTGDFATEAMDLAAAFGPVTGIATTLHFTDLLAMRTAPGQVATVRTVNPGIPVENGTIRYALEGPTLVRVEGAHWPFAGGTLTLEPTLLDFSENKERRLTFRVRGAAADQFLQQFDFDNLNATGIFDGVLPMVFDQSGGRIVDGQLAVREGGGTLAYVGALGQEQLGLWGNLAFQALKSLRYRSLTLRLNGPLTGEMVTDVRFAGISQGEGAKGNFIVRRLQRLPFVFNIRITAPFRGLLDSAQSFYDPKRLIQRNLPALLEEQNKRTNPPPVQPSASETVR